jgi:hypothetical protein
MLLRENKKNFCIAILLIAVLFYSCIDKTKKMNENGNLYCNISSQSASMETYKEVHIQIQDSLNDWCHNKLQAYAELWYYDYKIDPLICFNKESNKLVGALLLPCTKVDCSQDDIRFFYGYKIKGKWYFFSGATIVLLREMYQKDTHTPLSFSKLHEIAMKEVFAGYLIEKKTKKDLGWWKNTFSPEYEYKYEINERFFNELNIPLVPFSERKTNPNCPFSCRVIDNEKEYAECLLKKQALSVWNEECAFVRNDTYLYAPELPIGEKVISKINKGGSFKVIEYIDNTEWVYVRMNDHNPNLGLIHKNEISKRKP